MGFCVFFGSKMEVAHLLFVSAFLLTSPSQGCQQQMAAVQNLDLDKNNIVDAEELDVFLKSQGMEAREGKVEMMIGQLDLDRDGVLSFGEFHRKYIKLV